MARAGQRGPDVSGGRGHICLMATHVVKMSLPLHETIRKAWVAGKLSRVEEDGTPFRGDPWQLPDGGRAAPPEPDGEDDGEDVPERPRPSASRSAWAAYAVAIGAAAEDHAATLTRDQLIALCTAPEEQPGG